MTPVVACTCTWTRTDSSQSVLDCFHNVVGRLGLQKGGHILDAKRIATQVHQLFRLFNVAFDGVQRTDRVADRSLRVLARFFDCGDGALYVADIVQRVKHAKDVHAVVRGARHEAVHDRVFIMTIAEEILAA